MVIPRARAGALDTHYLSVLTAFKPVKLKQPLEELHQHHVTETVRRAVSAQTPATRRMLDALRAALTVRSDPARGYYYAAQANRLGIARRLGKGALVRYDIEMLRRLTAVGLIQERKQPLPVKTMRGADGRELQLGAGAEYVYSIPEVVLYALLVIDDPHAFDQLKEGNSYSQSDEPQGYADGKSFEASPAGQGFEDERELALLHRGHDFETDTHVYTWNAERGTYKKHKKTLVDKLKARLFWGE